MWKFIKKFLGIEDPAPVPPPPLPSSPAPVLPPLWSSLEFFGAPRHGKTSYLWALSYMARNLSLFWPKYACWPQDVAMDASFRAMLGAVDHREIPSETSASTCVGLSLRGMARWGDRRLFVEDDRDPVFGVADGTATNPREVNWGVPVCWLLSLPDLGTDEAQVVDLQLDNLIRARMRSARSFEAQPLRLVIALTKADRIADLPPELREYLKEDPLAAIVEAEALMAAGRGVPDRPALHFDERSVHLYLETLGGIHQKVAAWLATTLPGSLLAHRADAHHIDLRFCLVSATGSDLRSNGHLAIPWRPRRVLDPLFWALELGCR
jgi:hypothetical protein